MKYHKKWHHHICLFLILLLILLNFFLIKDSAKIFNLKLSKNFQFSSKSSFGKCMLCDVFPLASPSSTSRDLVITATTSRINRIEMLVRSLRSVGSRARFVVLVPIGTKIPLNILNCGVEFIEMSSASSRTLRSPHKIRWEWYYTYLTDHRSEFDRVFHTDAFDAFFLSDPFANWVRNDILYVAQEGRIIQICPINSHWISKCHGNQTLNQIGKYPVLCSGTLMGGIELFRYVAITMINESGWDDCWAKGYDQGEFNFLVYTKFINEISIQFMGCNSAFLTMSYCSQSQKIFFDSKMRLLSPFGFSHPIYAHQYNRYKIVDTEFQKKCKAFINRTTEKEKSDKEKFSTGYR